MGSCGSGADTSASRMASWAARHQSSGSCSAQPGCAVLNGHARLPRWKSPCHRHPRRLPASRLCPHPFQGTTYPFSPLLNRFSRRRQHITLSRCEDRDREFNAGSRANQRSRSVGVRGFHRFDRKNRKNGARDLGGIPGTFRLIGLDLTITLHAGHGWDRSTRRGRLAMWMRPGLTEALPLRPRRARRGRTG